ncbi:MAG: branched-chain amino acid aminotransferase, partial [Candidatus Omnitrophica bacterium CG_4_9_14_0_2_um_filter_43_12]
MSLKIYMNGKIIDEKQAKISIFDHGLLYGDGVFEGIRSYGELVFRLKEHIDRLYESAHTIMLKIPVSKQQMTAAVI